MKAVALSGVFVLASAGLALATVEAPVKPEAALPAPAAEDAAIVLKKTDAPDMETVALRCDGPDAATPLCAEAEAKN
jgi:hypothetical protein